MAAHIPFVNTQDDCHLLKKYYMDSDILRVSLEKIETIKSQLPRDLPLWVDPGIDSCHYHLKNKETSLPEYIKHFSKYEIFTSRSIIANPTFGQLKVFVTDVLNRCFKLKPAWITIPQLPLVEDNSRNKINTALAKATYEWKLMTQFRGKLILPLIFTHQRQLIGKTKWRPRMDTALKQYHKGGGDGVWVVDSSLSDQMGTETFRSRFSALIDLHKYVRSCWPKGTRVIAGPYWGMNLVLWARGLCEYPAVGLGSAYTYYIPGGRLQKGKTRLAIPPLRRWAVASPELRNWLDRCLKILNPEDIAYIELSKLKTKYDSLLPTAYIDLSELKMKFDSLLNRSAARDQVAKFYKNWFNKIEATPAVGRSLALYQDLSSAYVIGKQLPTMPQSGSAARRPERVAESFMLSCL